MMVFVGVAVAGATGAFFSDSETSTGNTFTAGAIDLGVDNHSYYNGVLQDGRNGTATTTWRIDYDIDNTEYPGDNPATPDVQENGYSLPLVRQFFNFGDLKPGDWGEDTISLHVKNNDSWLCADVKLTSDDDNDCTEPENDEEGTNCPIIGEPDGDNTDGDLADAVNFYWWADDGDNVFETCARDTGGILIDPLCKDETVLPAGPLGALNVNQTATVALADSQTNIWGDHGPLPGDSVRFVAKAWCFGDATMAPYAQDGGNRQSGPDDRPVICDGSGEDNKTQTDSMTADITFRAVQSRNNTGFLCNQP